MEQAMQGIAAQLMTNVIVPMFGSMLVIVAVMLVVLTPVRNRFVRQLGAFAAMLTWVGWMANYSTRSSSERVNGRHMSALINHPDAEQPRL